MGEFSHFDKQGNAVMVDVTDKADTRRTAVARGRIYVCQEVFDKIKQGEVQKGDVLGVARVAGIMAAKRTGEWIPMCHPLQLTKCSIDFKMEADSCSVTARCTAVTTGKTGVEMEALTGVSAALLTIYDMCKAIDRSMTIGEILLEEKSGGKSGTYRV